MIAGRKERWEKFMSGDGPDFMFMVRMPEKTAPSFFKLWPGNEKQFIESAWNEYLAQCERAKWLDDDFVPHLSCVGGTEIFAEAFGCEVHRPADTMPFALPKAFNSSGADSLNAPEMSTSSLARFFDIADELKRRGEDSVPLRLVDVQSPIDISALIWEKSDFLLSVIENPESVLRLSMEVRKLIVSFLEEWFNRYGREYIAHYPDYLMQGGLTLSEDECGCVSPEIFEELFLGHLTFLSRKFGGIGIHCCADSRHQWENFKKIPGLKLVNLVCPPARDGKEFIGDALKIFSGLCVQFHHGYPFSGKCEEWPSQIPPNTKFVFDINANSRDEAEKIAMEMNKLRNKRYH